MTGLVELDEEVEVETLENRVGLVVVEEEKVTLFLALGMGARSLEVAELSSSTSMSSSCDI